MATYAELYQIICLEVEGAGVLRRKVAIACLIAADTISSGEDTSEPFDQTAGMHEKRVRWAEFAYQGTRELVDQAFGATVSANRGASQAAILCADDATVQSAVNGVVDTLASVL